MQGKAEANKIYSPGGATKMHTHCQRKKAKDIDRKHLQATRNAITVAKTAQPRLDPPLPRKPPAEIAQSSCK